MLHVQKNECHSTCQAKIKLSKNPWSTSDILNKTNTTGVLA